MTEHDILMLRELQTELTLDDVMSEYQMEQFDALERAIEALQFQKELVRCKDCGYYDTEKGWVGGYCWMCHHDPSDVDIEWGKNEFCSKAKRRGEK